MQVCGCLGLQYAVRRQKGFGHMSLWLSRLCTYQRFVVSTPYAGWQGIGFMVSFTPYAITHMGSLCFVELLVPWITEDHGSILECWR